MEQFGALLAKAIEIRFKNKSSAIQQLKKWLFLEEDAIRRRLKGTTAFTLEEAFLLAEKLDISLDAIAKPNHKIASLNYNFYDKREDPFKDFLEDLLFKLEAIVDLEGVELYYATKGLPIFLYLNQPKLLAFKLFVWEIASWNTEQINGKKFSFDRLSPEHENLANKIHEYYCRIPSHEIWNDSILDSSFQQIQYVNNINLFEDENMIYELYDCLEDSISKAKTMAALGVKEQQYNCAPFHLYHAELLNAVNNVIYVKSTDLSYVSWTFCDPDYVATTDKTLCERAEDWLLNLIKHSNNITTHSFRIRNDYFTSLGDGIEIARQTRLVVNVE